MIFEICIFSHVFDIQTICRLASVSKTFKKLAYYPTSLCLPYLDFSKFGKSFDRTILSQLANSDRLSSKTKRQQKTRIILNIQNTDVSVKDIYDFEILSSLGIHEIFTGQQMNRKFPLRRIMNHNNIRLCHFTDNKNRLGITICTVLVSNYELSNTTKMKLFQLCDRYLPGYNLNEKVRKKLFKYVFKII